MKISDSNGKVIATTPTDYKGEGRININLTI